MISPTHFIDKNGLKPPHDPQDLSQGWQVRYRKKTHGGKKRLNCSSDLIMNYFPFNFNNIEWKTSKIGLFCIYHWNTEKRRVIAVSLCHCLNIQTLSIWTKSPYLRWCLCCTVFYFCMFVIPIGQQVSSSSAMNLNVHHCSGHMAAYYQKRLSVLDQVTLLASIFQRANNCRPANQ